MFFKGLCQHDLGYLKKSVIAEKNALSCCLHTEFCFICKVVHHNIWRGSIMVLYIQIWISLFQNLPDVFFGAKIILPEKTKDYRLLKRYIVGYPFKKWLENKSSYQLLEDFLNPFGIITPRSKKDFLIAYGQIIFIYESRRGGVVKAIVIYWMKGLCHVWSPTLQRK